MSWADEARNDAERESKGGRFLKFKDLPENEPMAFVIIGDPQRETFDYQGKELVSYRVTIRRFGQDDTQVLTIYPGQLRGLADLQATNPADKWAYRLTRIGKLASWEAIDPATEDDDVPFM